jgi:hypothetical protein
MLRLLLLPSQLHQQLLPELAWVPLVLLGWQLWVQLAHLL